VWNVCKDLFIATYFLSDFVSRIEEFLKDEYNWIIQDAIKNCFTLKDKISVFCQLACHTIQDKYQVCLDDEIRENICDITEEILKRDKGRDIYCVLDQIEKNLFPYLHQYLDKRVAV
jgi:hypothetical protein